MTIYTHNDHILLCSCFTRGELFSFEEIQ